MPRPVYDTLCRAECVRLHKAFIDNMQLVIRIDFRALTACPSSLCHGYVCRFGGNDTPEALAGAAQEYKASKDMTHSVAVRGVRACRLGSRGRHEGRCGLGSRGWHEGRGTRNADKA